MSRLLIFTCFLINSYTLCAQSVPDNYQFVGKIEYSGYHRGELVISPDSKFIVTDFSYKPSTITVFDIQNWKKVQSFQVKGWASISGAFFDRDNPDILYYGTRGRKAYKLNIADGSVQKIKHRDLPSYANEYLYTFWSHRQPSSTWEEGIRIRMLPEKYITKVYKNVIEVYIWKGLLN